MLGLLIRLHFSHSLTASLQIDCGGEQRQNNPFHRLLDLTVHGLTLNGHCSSSSTESVKMMTPLAI